MAHITLANETVPSTPASGNTILYTETTTKKLTSIADDGVARLVGGLSNATTTSQSISANTNTYITGANLSIPPSLLHVGAIFRWTIHVNKNGSQTGTAGPVWTVVFGTNGTISDTARLTFTGVAQTSSVADDMFVVIEAVVRSIGSGTAGVIEGLYFATHIGAAATQQTGFMNQPTDVKQNTSSGFDTTVASSIIGVGLNLGANTAGTIQHASVLGHNL
jgi:hypothetical protein